MTNIIIIIRVAVDIDTVCRGHTHCVPWTYTLCAVDIDTV